MADEVRSERDIAIARQVAEQYTDDFIFLLRELYQWRHPEVLGTFLDDVLQGLQLQAGFDGPFLDEETQARYLLELEASIQLFQFQYKLHRRVIVLKQVGNIFGAFPLVDIFNPSARAALSPPERGESTRATESSRNALVRWINRSVERSRAVGLIEYDAAAAGYLTLFTDSIRSIGRSFARRGTTPPISFTLSSNNHGYSVEYFPQFRFSPVIFGSHPTTPITAQIPVGHYYFQGRIKNGLPIQDPSVHYASPSNTSSHVSAF